MLTGKYTRPRTRGPLDRLMEAARERTDLAAEYESDSPGWSMVFVGRPVMLADATGYASVIMGDASAGSVGASPCVVITHGAAGAGWDLALYDNARAFGQDEDGSGMLEPIGFIEDADGDNPGAALDRALVLLNIPRGQRQSERIDAATSAAEEEFWTTVADAFPEIKSGDLDPMATIKFSEQAKRIVTTWVMTNRSATDD